MIFFAAYLSILLLIGHFTAGMNMYVRPMLQSNTEDIPKYVMYTVFHYMSSAMMLCSICLVVFAHARYVLSPDVIRFIGIFYILCAITQITIAIRSSGLNGLLSMFQWAMFLPVGILALLSA